MPEMISKTAHEYGGKNLTAGQRFHADQQYVATLIALGRAELAADALGEYRTRDMAAAPPANNRKKRRGA